MFPLKSELGLKTFINSYPYLFKQNWNRPISVINYKYVYKKREPKEVLIHS